LLASDDLALVRGLAGYVAMALDNAALYQSLERKANELAQLTRYNQSVIESIVVGVTVVSPEGEIRVWNNAMAAMSGLRTDWAVGRNIAEALPPDLLETVRHAAGGPGWTVREMAHIHKAHLVFQEGHPRLVNITLAPFLSQDDVVTGALLLFDDITEKSRLEEQLLQADRLSSIGLFAAGVAHEVNTPLAGVASYVQSLLQDTPPEDPRYELLQKIEKQSFRASGIINNLLNFARFDAAEFREVDLNSLMTDTVSLVEGQFRKGRIKISLELDPALPTTLGNGGRLQQVFMNLFLNARDAMPKGGRLQVRTFREDSALVVQVQDNGRGIAPEDVKRIYDPFFTRKGVGKGTGLGLSVSWGIIQEHAGRIKVDSTPGHGTVFTVQLPIHRLN
jgi:PAS domain S-box-containing protein